MTPKNSNKIVWSSFLLMIAIALLVVQFNKLNSTYKNIQNGKETLVDLKANMKSTKKTNHLQIKKIDSNFKKMEDAGKKVIEGQAEYADLLTKGKGNIDESSNEYKSAYSLFNNYVSNVNSSWNPSETPWTPINTWSANLVPGGMNATGKYDCSFVYKNKDNKVVMMIVGQFDPEDDNFINLNKYQTKDAIKELNQNNIKNNPNGFGK